MYSRERSRCSHSTNRNFTLRANSSDCIKNLQYARRTLGYTNNAAEKPIADKHLYRRASWPQDQAVGFAPPEKQSIAG